MIGRSLMMLRGKQGKIREWSKRRRRVFFVSGSDWMLGFARSIAV